MDNSYSKYYWIAPVDSIKNQNFTIYPLYIIGNEGSKFCQENDTIDLFIHETALLYNEYTDTLISLIENNHTKIQTIKVKWDKNKKSKLKTNIYITPITGNFCKCFQYHNDVENEFNSFFYFPVSNFYYDKSFWDLSTSKIILFSSYFYLDYKSDIFYNKGVQSALRN